MPPTQNLSKWTAKDIRGRTSQLLAMNNTEVLHQWFNDLATVNNEHLHVITDVLFENDRPDIAIELPTQYPTIFEWAANNFEFMVEHCPKTYSEWEQDDYEATVWSLSRVFRAYSSQQRERVLRGLGASKCEQRFHELLARHPWLWLKLPATWAGTTNSSLRKAAIALGWQQGMLLDMFVHNDVPDEMYCAVFRYPYSLFAIARIFHDMEDQEHQHEEDWHMCPRAARLEDIDLANALMAQAEVIASTSNVQKYTFYSFGQQQENGPKPELVELVKMYTSMQWLDEMLEMLSNDVFPVGPPHTSLELPALDL